MQGADLYHSFHPVFVKQSVMVFLTSSTCSPIDLGLFLHPHLYPSLPYRHCHIAASTDEQPVQMSTCEASTLSLTRLVYVVRWVNDANQGMLANDSCCNQATCSYHVRTNLPFRIMHRSNCNGRELIKECCGYKAAIQLAHRPESDIFRHQIPWKSASIVLSATGTDAVMLVTESTNLQVVGGGKAVFRGSSEKPCDLCCAYQH